MPSHSFNNFAVLLDPLMVLPMIFSPASCHTWSSWTFLTAGIVSWRRFFKSLICIWWGTEFIRILDVSIKRGMDVFKMMATIMIDIAGSTYSVQSPSEVIWLSQFSKDVRKSVSHNRQQRIWEFKKHNTII